MNDPEYEMCEFCHGCGQITNDEKAMPWKKWLALPLESRPPVTLGIVKPVLCPVCNGKGKVPICKP